MATITGNIPTLEDYAFDLRKGLKAAAKASLSSLEEMINEVGYGWLEGYMDGVTDKASRAPFAELIKTPSRTQTSKKTRATAQAVKDRTQKIQGLNAKLGLSPVTAKNSPARNAKSPLQARTINSPLSPANRNAMSPTKSRPEKPAPLISANKPSSTTAPEKPKPKAKAKKAKKGTTIDKENSENIDQSSAESSTVDMVVGYLSPAKALSPVKRVAEVSTRVTRSISRSPVKTAQEQSAPSIGAVAKRLFSDDSQQTNRQDKSTTLSTKQTPKSPTPKSVKQADLSLIAETYEDRSSSSIKSKALKNDNKAGHGDLPALISESNEAPAVPPKSPARPLAAKALSPLSDPLPISAPAPDPVPAPAPVPVRQVRSSWLRQALGTGTVPITGPPNDNLRKSFADASAMRKSYAPSAGTSTGVSGGAGAKGLEYAGLRKSLVPLGGLSAKRKSDEGLDEDEDRPEKVARVDFKATASSVKVKEDGEGLSKPTTHPQLPPLPVHTTFEFPLSTEEPIRASTSTSTSTSGPSQVPTVPVSANLPSLSNGLPDKNRSDIHKVTKALDEMRERNLAKQKAAALAASTASKYVIFPTTPAAPTTTTTTTSTATSGGSGFLRGLGSLGRSLIGGGDEKAEEVAVRLARELEDDQKAEREAEEELKRLMEGMKDEVSVVEARQPTMSHQQEVVGVNDHPFGRQTELSDDEEEEEEEEVDELEEDEVLEVLEDIGQTTSAKHSLAQNTTTPPGTPPKPLRATEAPALHDRLEKHSHPSPHGKRPTVLEGEDGLAMVSTQESVERGSDRSQGRPLVHDKGLDRQAKGSGKATAKVEREEEVVDELEEDDEVVAIPRKGFVPKQTQPSNRSSVASVVTSNVLLASTSSNAGVSLTQASLIAQKSLGVKSAPGHVKALALAAAARDKEQSQAERKQFLKDQTEQRKLLAARKKAEEERQKVEEEKKAKAVQDEVKRKIRLDLEKRRQEREERIVIAARDKAAREERENAAAAKIKADEEANRKRKMAPMLNKSSNLNPTKKVVPASGLNSSVKGKEPARQLASSTSTSKVGPNVFRTAPTGVTHQAEVSGQTSTVALVSSTIGPGPSSNNVGSTAAGNERRPLGPPSRPSAMAASTSALGGVANGAAGPASGVLQQSRVTLQSQLDQKAIDMQSEEIVLPDIASEYSDSDDEDKPQTFARPQWADSPELRRALEHQSTFNPDELFGPIKPLSMEEVFKVRTGKFRNRTSSANWGGGDRLTVQEEVEYAKKMGFRSK